MAFKSLLPSFLPHFFSCHIYGIHSENWVLKYKNSEKGRRRRRRTIFLPGATGWYLVKIFFSFSSSYPFKNFDLFTPNFQNYT
jgi:hypothetical protein